MWRLTVCPHHRVTLAPARLLTFSLLFAVPVPVKCSAVDIHVLPLPTHQPHATASISASTEYSTATPYLSPAISCIATCGWTPLPGHRTRTRLAFPCRALHLASPS
ncbi:hypothetical protein M431DRAFT_468997 [Trichoderma harzianum CBS 226.95]|uniref:Secreted protein n=1 Tax=Trichoderma harzianum CBS 226.95 TaxID=983964 RepID=A0A2T4A6F4_TRIHA|nr:hypothetical protein M431DRAFT_468997 [Trichoderma harzianum CBS 226.95]PTB52662.1 hypothetical protein M431DRAFT_468997 [Trichoderma harzianum CBS 226.95]